MSNEPNPLEYHSGLDEARGDRINWFEELAKSVQSAR